MKRFFDYQKIPAVQKESFFSELQSLLQSGLSFSRSFALLTEGEANGKVRGLYDRLYEAVAAGKALWEGMKDTDKFSSLDYGVIRIGEETGQLASCLGFLADYYRKRRAQRRMVSGALSYPLIVLGMTFAVMIFMLTVIVPMFEQVYLRMGKELPGITRGVIRFSADFPFYLAGLGVLTGIVAISYAFYGKTEFFQRTVSGFCLRIPRIGAILRKSYEVRICRLLYLLYGSGVPLLKALGLLEEIILFYPYRKSFREVGRGLCEGKSFAGELARYPLIYNRKLVALLQVGEETNRLGEMFKRQSEELTEELDYKLKQLGNLAEPLLVLLVGILVALVLIAMYMPMFKLGNVLY